MGREAWGVWRSGIPVSSLCIILQAMERLWRDFGMGKTYDIWKFFLKLLADSSWRTREPYNLNSLLLIYPAIVVGCTADFYLWWRIVLAECCVGFCCTTMWDRHKYTHITTLIEPPSETTIYFCPTPQFITEHRLKHIFVYFNCP